MAFKIYLSPPNMGGTEIKYIQEAFETNWIAPNGPSLDQFEEEMAQYVGISSSLALSSGTAGIHLALRYVGVQQGDYVFSSDFTFIGSCDAIMYEKAVPVFIDSEPDSWNMSPVALEKAFKWVQKEGKMPKAVIVVDLYGESADWKCLLPICRKYGVPVIEDAAESLGTVYKGKKCGSFGDYSVLSFNGNKILTTSSGGMVLSNDQKAIDKMRFWSTQAREQVAWYEHKEYGYNYRMSNICACIGRGQLKFLEEKLVIRNEIYEKYRTSLNHIPAHIKTHSETNSANCWLSLLVFDSQDIIPTDIVSAMQKAQIETRPVWKPMHMQPLFEGCLFFTHGDKAIDEEIFAHSICLPSGDCLSEEEVDQVICELNKCFNVFGF